MNTRRDSSKLAQIVTLQLHKLPAQLQLEETKPRKPTMRTGLGKGRSQNSLKLFGLHTPRHITTNLI